VVRPPRRSEPRDDHSLSVRRERRLFGYADKSGRLVIPCRFESAGRFSEGLAAVKLQGKWGFIDYDGKMVISARYDEADDFDHGTALVLDGSRGYLLIDASGAVRRAERTDHHPITPGRGR